MKSEAVLVPVQSGGTIRQCVKACVVCVCSSVLLAVYILGCSSNFVFVGNSLVFTAILSCCVGVQQLCEIWFRDASEDVMCIDADKQCASKGTWYATYVVCNSDICSNEL